MNLPPRNFEQRNRWLYRARQAGFALFLNWWFPSLAWAGEGRDLGDRVLSLISLVGYAIAALICVMVLVNLIPLLRKEKERRNE